MEARELRVGNLVQHEPTIDDWEEIILTPYSLLQVDISPDSYCGIPLTEEWLLKFGLPLVKKDKAMYGDVARTDDFLSNENAFYYVFDSIETQMGDWHHVSKQIHYVHELQNIYYIYMNKELTIKEKG